MGATKQQRTIARNLRAAREDAGLSQGKLAKKACTTQRVISNIENCKYKPSAEYLKQIGKALGIDATDFLA